MLSRDTGPSLTVRMTSFPSGPRMLRASTASWIDQPRRTLTWMIPASIPPAAADRMPCRSPSESSDTRFLMWQTEQTPASSPGTLSAYSTLQVTRCSHSRQRNSRYFARQAGQRKLSNSVAGAGFPHISQRISAQPFLRLATQLTDRSGRASYPSRKVPLLLPWVGACFGVRVHPSRTGGPGRPPAPGRCSHQYKAIYLCKNDHPMTGVSGHFFRRGLRAERDSSPASRSRYGRICSADRPASRSSSGNARSIS